ncbi:MAG TPA: DUF4097 family beta strand repeat-containing protein [Actinocatenispora sp.]
MQPEEHPRRRLRLAIPAAAFVVLLLVVGVAVLLSLRQSLSPAHRETLPKKTYTGLSKLAVDVNSADVTLQPGTGRSIVVERSLTWNNDRPSVRVEKSGDTLDVGSEGCRSGIDFGFTTCRVKITVTLPATMPVSLRIDSGDARVSGLSGALKAHMSSGNLRLSRMSGAIDADVDSGDLIGDEISSATVHAESSSGDLRFEFGAAPDRVVARSSSGDVNLRLPRISAGYAISTDVSSGDRRVPASHNGSPHRLDLAADSGDVTVDYAD